MYVYMHLFQHHKKYLKYTYGSVTVTDYKLKYLPKGEEKRYRSKMAGMT